MMTHLDEGLLRALLDGEIAVGDADSARTHVDECDHCQALLEELQDTSTVIGAALERLDAVAAPGGAKAAVLARVSSAPQASRRAAPAVPERFAFARAAILVLFFGGVVATALPASPVRGWLGAGLDRVVDLFTGSVQDESAVTPVEIAPTLQAAEAAGVSLEVEGGELVVLLKEIEPGTELDVRFVDGFRAAAFAEQPARFRTADGLIEVTGVSGRVRVDIPRSVEFASIHVNGRMYITKNGDELDVAGSIVTRTRDEIRLRIQ